ncbi:MAG: hypothetical protein ACR2L2_15945 [Acidobacteriota bacterium]
MLLVALMIIAPLVYAQEVQRTVIRQVWAGDNVEGTVSSDGLLLSWIDDDTDNVNVVNLKTGQSHRLTDEAAGPGGALYSIISPDGKQVAYSWINKDHSCDLRIIGADGSRQRVLYQNEEVSQIRPREWSPRRQQVLATFWMKGGTYKVVLISLLDGSTRVLKTFGWRRLYGENKMSFSPDGRYIAYDSRQEESSLHRNIFVLPADGGREVPLITTPANNRLLGWTPDGKWVLFASDRTGTWDLWLVGVGDGKPKGLAKLIKRDIGPSKNAIGFTREGSYYYTVYGGVNDVYLATLDPVRGKIYESKKLVSRVGFNTSVEWSPDGHYLAYASGAGGEHDPFVLGIRSIETGKERRLRLNKMTRFGGHSFQPHWSPDGRFLLAQGRNSDYMGPGRDSQGLYRIDAQTGKIALLVQTQTICPPDCIEWPVWTRNGKVIFTRWISRPRSIVARDFETGRETELLRAVSPAELSHLTVSADGQWLAFIWWDQNGGKTVLKVMPASGGEAREIFKLPAPALADYAQPLFALAWTYDSRHMIFAFASSSPDTRQTFELWRISAEGGKPEHIGLAMEGLLPYGLSVHPDGRRIAFTAGTPTREEVWVIENFLPRSDPAGELRRSR